MANTAQAKKRARQAEGRRVSNSSQRSFMRTAIKKVAMAIESGDKAAASEAYRSAASAIDRIAGKGLIHKNAAARQKSRINSRVATMV